MDAIAQELNQIILKENPYLMEMMSAVGKHLYFPKGLLSQGAEAKEKAHKTNATIGIATEKHETMYFPSIMERINDIAPEESLTYASSYGIPALRNAWKTQMKEKNPGLADGAFSLPVVTCGVTHALSTFADIWIDPGDVVVLPDLTWGNYKLIFNVRKGARLSNYAFFSTDGGFNVKAFEARIRAEAKTTKKVIVLLNFPNNPSGYSITKSEGKQMVNVLTDIAEQGTNIIAACDDSYFGLFYEEGVLTESPFAKLFNQHPRLLAVKLDGATKENFVWGLRIGFVTYGCGMGKGAKPVYEALEKKTGGCIRGSISSASHLSQTIVLKSLKDPRYHQEKKGKFEILKSRAAKIKAVLKDDRYVSAWDAYPFNSGYFMCLRLKTVNAETLRCHLLDKYGVGLISIGEENLRVAFSCLEEEEIPELFDIIYQGVTDLTV